MRFLSLLAAVAGLLSAVPSLAVTFARGVVAVAPVLQAVSGDWNGDGRSDFAVVPDLQKESRVEIHLATGGGSFRKGAEIDVGRAPFTLLTGDFNGDGRIDLGAALYQIGAFRPLLGDGTGGFTPADEQPTYEPFARVFSGDLNADGRSDLVTTRATAYGEEVSRIFVQIMGADGVLGPRRTLETGRRPVVVAIADWNGDGRNDIATVDHGSDTVSVFLNSDDGSFGPRTALPIGRQPVSLAALDTSGDGRPELVVSYDYGESVDLLLNRGDGTFGPRKHLPLFNDGYVSSGAFPATIADWDRDGRPDLLVPRRDEHGGAHMLRNDGSGSLIPSGYFSAGFSLNYYGFMAGDYDGDGWTDAATWTGSQVVVFRNRGDSSIPFPIRFGDLIHIPFEGAIAAVALADLNGDGKLDIAAAAAEGSAVRVRMGNGDGSFGNDRRFDAGNVAVSIEVADLNGDGLPEILCGLAALHPETGKLVILTNQGNGNFGDRREYPVNEPKDIVVADLNADGRPDIATANGYSAGESGFLGSVLLNRGDGTFDAPVSVLPMRLSTSVAAGDANGDGHIDLLFTNFLPYDINAVGTLLPGKGGGTFGDPLDLPYGAERFDPRRQGDFNGDGRLDFADGNAAVSEQNGTRLFLGRPDGSFQVSSTVALHAGGPYPFVADFNRDGAPDLINGWNYSGHQVVAGTGDAAFGSEFVTVPLTDKVATGDVNNDGRIDLLTVSGHTNKIGLLLLLNRSPEIAVRASRSAVKAGDRIEFSLTTLEPTELPTVTVSGSCIETAGLNVSSAGENRSTAAWTVPVGTTDCVAMVKASARAGDGQTPTGEMTLFVDRTPSATVPVLNGQEGVAAFRSEVYGSYRTEDASSGALRVFHALDDPRCSPATPAFCEEWSRPNARNGYQQFFTAAAQGTHTLSYFSIDQAGNVEPGRTFSFRIDPNPPTAQPTSASTDEDTPVVVSLIGSDGGNTDFTFRIVEPPKRGRLGPVTGDRVVYTPDPNASGHDEFIYEAFDGVNSSASVKAVIEVRPVNDPPAVKDVSVLATEDQPKEITVEATDPDGDPVTLFVATPPSHGTAVPAGPGRILYTPVSDYNGLDSFTYRASDGKPSSEAATVRVTVIPVNDAPVAAELILATERDAPLVVRLSASDPDGDQIVYRIVENPLNGTLSSLDGDRVVYTPRFGFQGRDRFTYAAVDGAGESVPAPVTVRVGPIENQPPYALDRPVVVVIDDPEPVTLEAVDAEGDPLAYEVLDRPAHGTLAGTAPALVYRPNPGYTGSDSFTFRAGDGVSFSRMATVSVEVVPPVLVIGDGAIPQGGRVTVPIRLIGAGFPVAGIDLALRVTVPPGTAAPVPSFAPVGVTAGWEIIRDPADPWRLALADETGAAGPSEMLTLDLRLEAPVPPGTIYRIEARTVVLSGEDGVDRDVTNRVVSGEVTVVGCVEREAGDVNGDGRVGVADATAILRAAVGLAVLSSDCASAAADMNRDGRIGIGDVILVLRRAVESGE